ncbi:MAG: hypothetical protein OER95_00820 [Acidimicrobiia bacterium]|nr:hypothetical protein [Acidimicrobiia bacterium]
MSYTTPQRPTSPALLAGLTSLERSQRAAWRAANLPNRHQQVRYAAVARSGRALAGRLRHPFQPPKTTQPAW